MPRPMLSKALAAHHLFTTFGCCSTLVLAKAGFVAFQGTARFWPGVHLQSLLPTTSSVRPCFSGTMPSVPSLDGQFFIYSSEKRLPAFQSGPPPGQRRGYALLVPGLTDGPLGLPYVELLAERMEGLGYSLVQPILSSSYKGYGISSLRQDIEELEELLTHLASAQSLSPDAPSSNVIFIGHSTGCQDAVFFMAHGRPELRARVRGVVLQGPVSDREYRETYPETKGLVEHARGLKPEELMPVTADEAPITAQRFLSLSTKEGEDEMFSSDLSFEERWALMGHMASVPTATFLSGADEYVPPGEGRTPEALAEAFRSVLIPSGDVPGISPVSQAPGLSAEGPGDSSVSRVHIIEGGSHNLQSEVHTQEFVSEVEAFVRTLDV